MNILAACDRPEPAAQEPGNQPEAPVEAAQDAPVEEVAESEDGKEALPGDGQIAWFDGTVEEAFARARADDVPMFLYWGAVWCPPCVEIRNTVFKSPQFIAQARLFLPVYLDGDTERAQTWGDTFDAKVYPTMIVFNPAGQEITRLHAGIDISAYNTVLELSLDRMKPTSELVRMGMADPASLGDADLRQLAYYSWYDGKALHEDTPPELFLRLSEAAADRDPEASARLYLQYLSMRTTSDETDERPDVGRLSALLDGPSEVFASWDYLITPESLLPAIDDSQAAVDALKARWAGVMKNSRHHADLSTKNQLYGWRPWLVFHFEGDEERSRPLPDDVREAILDDVEEAAKSVAGTHSRQSVINTASNLLRLAGLTDEARFLLQTEIGKSKTPYYFIGSLASLEEAEGNDAIALDWHQKAYETAEGPATRIRWWARYVPALTRLAPGSAETIEEVAMYPFDESQGMSEIFSGANFRNLERAAESLGEWAAEYHPDESVLADFDAAVAALCEAQAEGSVERGNCSSL
ncbi:MAG: thioredoxin family protein [Xanthomonadales bacterium]|nr:thioredoxin family protein [Xanthomonadales bacterium]